MSERVSTNRDAAKDTCERVNEILAITELEKSSVNTGTTFQTDVRAAVDRIEEKINQILEVDSASCPQ